MAIGMSNYIIKAHYAIVLKFEILLCNFREVVALLLEHEASPNIVDNKGSTPLHLAAWAGHADIVRLILTQGVRITQINLRVSQKFFSSLDQTFS